MGYVFYVDSSRHFVSVLLLFCLCDLLIAVTPRDDICGNYNGKRVFIELGKRGVLTARNISSTSVRGLPYSTSNWRQNGSHIQCNVELITCPSCVVVLTYRHLDLPHRCGGEQVIMDNSCRCDYVWVSEPPNGEKSGAPFCGVSSDSQTASSSGPLVYRSQTRSLSITLLFSESHRHAFTLEYSVERNRQFLKGAVNSGSLYPNESKEGLLTSPFFPALYPRDLGVEYVINCQLDSATNCRVRIIFQDFLLATLSIMEFYDWNGSRIEVSSGGVFRPPVILSSGPSLMIRFYANGGTGLGYKAVYSFVADNIRDDVVIPVTDCGGYVENLGGAITMMNMVVEGVKTYDCVWLIRPPKNFLHLKTHLSLKVASFLDMADSTDLKVLQGMTSDQPVLETLRYPIAQIQQLRPKEHIIPAEVGFYVSLRGSFNSHSRLAIVYAAFSYMDCYTGSDFLCQNHRCIPIQLHCDGFDHCGDESDEPESCFQGWEMPPQDKVWYAHTPNYYFPKMERYPDLKTATMVFVISSLGLILLISALIVLLYHMGSRARQQRELQNRLQTISDLLGDGTHMNDSLPPDEPPTYEAPPDYDDIIKVFDKPSTPPRQKSRRHRVRTQSSPGVHMTLKRDKLVSTLDRSTPIIMSRSCQTTPVPDTPPPPYRLHGNMEPSGSSVDRSYTGTRRRESWLLFHDTSDDSQTSITQQLENTSVLNTPPSNSHSSPSDADNILNLTSIARSTEERDRSNSTPTENPIEMNTSSNMQLSFGTEITTNSVFESILLPTNSNHDDKLFQVKESQKISLSLDSLLSRSDIGLSNSQSIHKISDVSCNCAGACGCASLINTQRYNGIPRSLPDGLNVTRSEENSHALDIYFSHHDFGSELRSHF